jgi:hypothetical protein
VSIVLVAFLAASGCVFRSGDHALESSWDGNGSAPGDVGSTAGVPDAGAIDPDSPDMLPEPAISAPLSDSALGPANAVASPAAGNASANATDATLAPEWPQNGSYVKYELSVNHTVPEKFTNLSAAEVTWVYRGGEWANACEASYDRVEEDGSTRSGSFSRAVSNTLPRQGPLFDARDVEPGDRVAGWHMWGCRSDNERLKVDALKTLNITLGDTPPRSVTAWTAHADGRDDRTLQTAWDDETGIVLSWDLQYARSTTSGRLIGTDAPLD